MAKVRQTNTTRFLEAPFVRMLRMRSASLKKPKKHVRHHRGQKLMFYSRECDKPSLNFQIGEKVVKNVVSRLALPCHGMYCKRAVPCYVLT